MTGLKTATGVIPLDRCLVMGIVNRTPDSFYDGGRTSLRDAVAHGLQLADEGADLLDLGAVSAGPGGPVSEEAETNRLLPLVRELVRATDLPLSVETSRGNVARRALDEGAAMVNDVAGLRDAALADVCAMHRAALVVMHNGSQFRSRPRNPRYVDVVKEVVDSLRELAARATAAGVVDGSIVVDPGLDFGKNTMHSLELIRRLDEVVALGLPLLVAPSRKDVVGETLGLAVGERLEGTLAVVALSVLAGAAIVRVHDVEAARRVAAMTEAVAGRRRPAAPVRGLWD